MTKPPLDQTFFALSDPARRRLIEELARGPRTAGALAEPFRVSRPAISRHLRVLREAGLVRVDERGRERWYRLDGAALEEAGAWMVEVQAMWDEALGSLKRYLEEGDADRGEV